MQVSTEALKRDMTLLVNLTRRDFRLRYLGSILGSYWNLVHPVVMILIYTVIFSKVMHTRLTNAGPYSYSLYLCSGIIAWNFFVETVNRSATSLLDNASFLKKINVSPLVLFGATISSSFINFCISFGVFTVALCLLKPIPLSLYCCYWLVVLLFGGMAFSMGLTLGCLNVLLRDVQQMVSVIFQLWFWCTPLVYLRDQLPELPRKLVILNPAFPFVETLHQLAYFQEPPRLDYVGLMLGWDLTFLLIGIFIYRRSISFVRDQL